MERLDEQDLWAAGVGGYHTYRIPALAVTTAGTVLAFCEGRRHGPGDSGEIDLLWRRSEDGGRTWSSTGVVTSRPGHTRGNPAPVVDRTTGMIHLLFTENPAEVDETAICAGTGVRRVWQTDSDDAGASWSEPVELTEQVKDRSWTWYATGPCHGVQLASGRLVVPCDHIVGKDLDRWRDPHHAHLIYSDDHGATWRIGGRMGGGTNESTVAQLDNGRLYVNARNYGSKGARAYAYSDDGGESFGPLRCATTLIEPTCQGSVLWHPEARALLFANPASTRRERLTVRASRDRGATWDAGLVVWDGPAAYSDLAGVRDEAEILCLYECGEKSPYERLRLARLVFD